jgi:methylenetetrahydrofolate dehydrogenase (NADP+)/methenyltetrahydrofolate cyclohydrolase
MTAVILDGTKIAAQIRAEVGEEVKHLTAEGLRPGLAVVLVGHNPASEIYVRGKIKASEELGILSEKHTPPESVTTDELLVLIDDLNHRDDIDGILVQLPLPAQVDSKKVLLAVSPEKDVDGFHPMNVGYLSTQRPGLVPCTPAGVIEILKRSNIPIVGAEAVVVGRSDIVGKPVAMLLLNGNATVTLSHSKTRDLPVVCREAGRNRDRCRHEQDHRSYRVCEVLCRRRQTRGSICQEWLDADRRCRSQGGRSRGRNHSRPRWCWPSHHRDVNEQYREGR